MYLLFTIIAFWFFVGLYFNWNAKDRGLMFFNTALVVLMGTLFSSMLALPGARGLTADEVPVEFPIYEGPTGRYLDNGTSGETNYQVTIYYYKNDGALRKSWQDSDSTAVRTTTGSAYAAMTCPDASNAWSWSLFPWEDPEPDCSTEFITFYLPQGES